MSENTPWIKIGGKATNVTLHNNTFIGDKPVIHAEGGAEDLRLEGNVIFMQGSPSDQKPWYDTGLGRIACSVMGILIATGIIETIRQIIAS